MVLKVLMSMKAGSLLIVCFLFVCGSLLGLAASALVTAGKWEAITKCVFVSVPVSFCSSSTSAHCALAGKRFRNETRCATCLPVEKSAFQSNLTVRVTRRHLRTSGSRLSGWTSRGMAGNISSQASGNMWFTGVKCIFQTSWAIRMTCSKC